MDYLDFELEIGAGGDLQYPVALLRSPAGEARASMRFPFDDDALRNRLLTVKIALLESSQTHRKLLSEEEQAVQQFSASLFDALVAGELRSLYDVSRSEAARLGKGLRIKLRIQSPELALLPWEFLFDTRRGGFLGLSTGTPVVRYLELAERVPTLQVQQPVRILGLVASPENLDPLDVPREQERIEKAVEGLRERGLVELVWLPGQTWRDVQRAMRGGPWHVFHFVGHGGFDRLRDEGTVALVDEDGQADYISATHLAQLLGHHFLRLVLLNACESARTSKHDIFSSTAATLVRSGIPAVVAMQYSISDRAAIEFARTFYEALADGVPVDGSVAEARNAINLAIRGSLEWATPVLHMRSADGHLFQIGQQTASAVRREPFPPAWSEAVEIVEPLDQLRPGSRETEAVPVPIQETRAEQQRQLAAARQALLRTLRARVGMLTEAQRPQALRALAIRPSEPAELHHPTLPISAKQRDLRLQCTLEGHVNGALDLSFTSDGTMLAIGCGDSQVRVWRLADRTLVHALVGPAVARCVAIAPGGQLLASGADDGSVRLWSLSEASWCGQ